MLTLRADTIATIGGGVLSLPLSQMTVQLHIRTFRSI